MEKVIARKTVLKKYLRKFFRESENDTKRMSKSILRNAEHQNGQI